MTFNRTVKSNWILPLLLFGLVAIYLATTRYAPGSGDTYWHLALGRQVLEEKTIPTNDKFVYSYDNPEFVSIEWLSGVVSYLFTLSPLGLNGLIILRVILAISTLYFIKKSLDILDVDKKLTYALLTLNGFIFAVRFSIDRPESFSYLIIAATIYFGLAFTFKKELPKISFFLPILYLVWPHMHPISPYGAFLLIFFLFINYPYKKVKKAKTFIIISIVSVLASLMQFTRFFYFLHLTSVGDFQIKEMASLASRLSEIRLPYPYLVPVEAYVYFAFLALFLSLGVIYFKKSKSKHKEKLLIITTLALLLVPFLYFRQIILSILIATPVLGFLVQNSLSQKKVAILSVSTACLFVLLMLVSITQGRTFGLANWWQYIENLSTKKIAGVRTHNWTSEYPHRHVAVIKEHLNSKRIFSATPIENYFIYHLPGIQTSSDVMFEYQTKEGFDKQEAIRYGGNNWQTYFEEYQIDTVVNSQPEPSFTSSVPVSTLDNWKLVYINEEAALWAREDIIKSYPVDLSRIDPAIPTTLKFKKEETEEAVNQLEKLLAYDPKNLFARRQLIEYYLENTKNYTEVERFALESYKIGPKYPYFSYFLTKIYANTNRCPQAVGWAQETKNKSFSDVIIMENTNNALIPCSTKV